MLVDAVIETSQKLVLEVRELPFSKLPESWQHFVLSSFITSLARVWSRKATDADWTRARRRALAILESPTTVLNVACAQDTETDVNQIVIIGWLAHAQDVIHFVFTRPGYRGAGVAKALVELVCKAQWIPCTHWSKKLSADGWQHKANKVFFYCGVDRIKGHAISKC